MLPLEEMEVSTASKETLPKDVAQTIYFLQIYGLASTDAITFALLSTSCPTNSNRNSFESLGTR